MAEAAEAGRGPGGSAARRTDRVALARRARRRALRAYRHRSSVPLLAFGMVTVVGGAVFGQISAPVAWLYWLAAGATTALGVMSVVPDPRAPRQRGERSRLPLLTLFLILALCLLPVVPMVGVGMGMLAVAAVQPNGYLAVWGVVVGAVGGVGQVATALDGYARAGIPDPVRDAFFRLPHGNALIVLLGAALFAGGVVHVVIAEVAGLWDPDGTRGRAAGLRPRGRRIRPRGRRIRPREQGERSQEQGERSQERGQRPRDPRRRPQERHRYAPGPRRRRSRRWPRLMAFAVMHRAAGPRRAWRVRRNRRFR